MPRGRPPKPGTAEEKAAARREKVRLNVKALRERRKQAAFIKQTEPKTSELLQTEEEPSHASDAVDDPTDVENINRDSTETLEQPKKVSRLLGKPRSNEGILFAYPRVIDPSNQYAFALLGFFRAQFLPDAVHLPSINRQPVAAIAPNDDFIWTPCAFWVTSAFSKASYQTNSNLRNTLLAIGMALNGVKHDDEKMTAASLEMYRRSLRGLRGSLDQIAADQSTALTVDRASLFLTCHAAAMFELIQNSNLAATMQHVVGLGQLMLHLGEGHEEQRGTIPGLLLQDYRTLELPFCLRYRYEPKLSNKRRQGRMLPTTMNSDFGGRAFGALYNSNMINALTDTADDICLIMVRLDRLKLHAPLEDAFPEMRILLERLVLILSAFDIWTSQLKARYGPIEVQNTPVADANNEPFRFTSFELGSAYMFSQLIRAYGTETCIEIVQLLMSSRESDSSVGRLGRESKFGLHPEKRQNPHRHDDLEQKLRHFRSKLRSTTGILARSISYFLGSDKGIIGQTMGLFPLEAAQEMLCKEMKRLQEDLRHLRSQPVETLDSTNEVLVQALMDDVKHSLSYCKQKQQRAHDSGMPSSFAG